MPAAWVNRIAGLIGEADSVNAAAKAIGIPQPTLARILSGERGLPKTETLAKIADFYGTTVDWLLTGRGAGPLAGPDRYIEGRAWIAITREVAGDDAELSELLTLLPRTLEAALVLIEDSVTGEAVRETVAAVRQERAAWVRFFRAWIDHAGIEDVRKTLKRNRSKFERRFAPEPEARRKEILNAKA